MESDLFQCPRCQTSKYDKPSMRMMVNVCGHGLCDTCVDRLFQVTTGPCPVCNKRLQRSNFREQICEDVYIEKELHIRKKVMKDFNKLRDDFKSDKEFDDYLETVEAIIFNLTNEIDVENTQKRIEAYKRENKRLVGRARETGELSFLDSIIEAEHAAKDRFLATTTEAERAVNDAKRREDAALMGILSRGETVSRGQLDAARNEIRAEAQLELARIVGKQPTTSNVQKSVAKHVFTFEELFSAARRGANAATAIDDAARNESESEADLSALESAEVRTPHAGPALPNPVQYAAFIPASIFPRECDLPFAAGGYSREIAATRLLHHAFGSLFVR